MYFLFLVTQIIILRNCYILYEQGGKITTTDATSSVILRKVVLENYGLDGSLIVFQRQSFMFADETKSRVFYKNVGKILMGLRPL